MSCPVLKKVLGGGYDKGDGAGVTASMPMEAGAGWQVEGGLGTTGVVYAICATLAP